MGLSAGAAARAQDAPAADGEPAPAENAGPSSAASDEMGGVLDRFVADVDDFSARFEQQDFDADGELVETSVGRFSLLRPDRYLWHYERPFEQIIVADGETVWMYDVELEQVTRAPLDDLSASPVALLSGESAVRDAYQVRELPPVDDSNRIGLIPLANDVEFSSATIAFRAGVPAKLELIDGLGELTVVEFFDVEVNAGIDASRFEFEPPRGVDVIGAD